MKTARPRNLAVLLGSALALLSYYPPPSDGGSAFIYRATAPLHPPTPTPRTSPAAAGSEATGPGPGRRGSSCFCRGGGDAAEHRLFRRLRRSRARTATASNRNCGGGGGRPPSFVGRFRPDPGMQISVFALEDRFAEPGGDNDNVEEGREPSPQNQSPPTFSTPPDSSSPFVSPADAHHPPYTSASASSPQAAVRPNYSSFAGRTSVMRESAVVVDWDPVSELERRVDHGASYEHWPEYATNVHRVWERRREGGDVAAGRGDRGPPVGGIGGDGGQPSGCTYDADADDDDDVAVPVTRGVFCGFRVTAEERRRLRSASDDDDDVNAERDYEI